MSDNFQVKAYLSKEGVTFDEIAHHAEVSLPEIVANQTIPGGAIARALLLKDEGSFIMAVVPAGDVLDYAELCRVLSKTLDPVETLDPDKHEGTGIANYVYPLPPKYNVPAIVDNKLLKQEKIYLEDVHEGHVYEISGKDFEKLLGNVHIGDFTIPHSMLTVEPIPIAGQEPVSVVSNFMSKRLNQRIEETYELPIVPDIARQLLELRVDPDASAVELAEIVEMDPSLSARVKVKSCVLASSGIL